MMDQKQFASALKQICQEKGISEKQVMETMESALAAAYRKDYGNKLQNIKVEFNPEDGSTKIFDIKTIVEDVPEEDIAKKTSEDEKNTKNEESKDDNKGEKDNSNKIDEKIEEEEIRRFNPKTEIQISDAKKIKKSAKIGDEIITKLDQPDGYGRMAAQTAKQVIIQKLREAERNTIFEEMEDKEGSVVNGIIQRYDRGIVLVSIGRATAILPYEQQIRRESYNVGAQMKFYILSVGQTARGPEIIVSRKSEEILRELFSVEIPEISSGIVEIKGISREAGERSKVAVSTDDKSIDPIGSCIGQRGNRIQTIINELNGEKIDIIEYSDNAEKFITNSLSPAKIISITINEEDKSAIVAVKSDQLSLAIGKGGQNARLAAKLTGWKIDIEEIKSEKDDESDEEDEKPTKEEDNTVDTKEEGAKESNKDEKDGSDLEKTNDDVNGEK